MNSCGPDPWIKVLATCGLVLASLALVTLAIHAIVWAIRDLKDRRS